jgi:hypothetical protein
MLTVQHLAKIVEREARRAVVQVWRAQDAIENGFACAITAGEMLKQAREKMDQDDFAAWVAAVPGLDLHLASALITFTDSPLTADSIRELMLAIVGSSRE